MRVHKYLLLKKLHVLFIGTQMNGYAFAVSNKLFFTKPLLSLMDTLQYTVNTVKDTRNIKSSSDDLFSCDDYKGLFWTQPVHEGGSLW